VNKKKQKTFFAERWALSLTQPQAQPNATGIDRLAAKNYSKGD
jgi:hypothetical protein